MAVYDPENENDEEPKSLTPEEISEREQNIGDSYNSRFGGLRHARDSARDRHADLREQSQAADAKEQAAVEDRLRGAYGGFKKDDEENSLYHPNKDSPKAKGLRGRAGSFMKKRNLLIGGGLGLGLITAVFGLFGFLNVFRLDHIISSLDQKTFARFNASFDGRSDAWFRSYLKIRMAEIEGGIDPADDKHNVYFSATGADTDNPIKDWYKKLRNSSFEDDLLKNQGIRFKSALDAEGNIRPALITINNRDIDIDVGEFKDNKVGDINFNNFLRQIDGEFDAKLFGSSREARRAIRQAVNDNTKKHQVFRRRHMRRYIANKTGVREWRLFEKSRDKIDNAKLGVQKKIMNKVFSGDSSSMRFLNCLLAGTRCPNTTDPVDPDNKVSGVPDGRLSDSDPGNIDVDDPGNPLPDGEPARFEGDRLTREASEAVSEGAQEFTDEFTPTQQVLKNVVDTISSTVTGPAAVWKWAARLAVIDSLFSGGKESKAAKLVYNARTAQLVAFYATMVIGRDQIRSGELVGDEMNGFYDTTKNFGNSEAWGALNNSYDSGSVGAQATTNTTRDEYCKTSHEKTFNEYAYYCDSYKPNSGNRAEDVSTAYTASIGWLIGPIADAVNAVRKSFLGRIVDAFANIIDAVIGEIGKVILDALGISDDIGVLVGKAMAWLLEFAGGGPFIDPGKPGFAAWLMGGSVGTAETAARSAGGTRSTETSYKYSKDLAKAHEKDRLTNMSWSERYLSLDNPDSIASSFAFSTSNVAAGESIVSKLVDGMARAPSTLLSIMTRPARAAKEVDLAELAGVNTYDIPQVCIDLDPLDPGYLQKATNADIGPRTYENLSNEDTFWQAVYDNPSITDKESIYNCALLDKTVRAGMGYLYGYSDDGGYE